MAEISNEIFTKELKEKLVTVSDFRKKFAEGISQQALSYAIKHDKIDYVVFDNNKNNFKLIVLTEKTLSYKPSKSKTRLKTAREK